MLLIYFLLLQSLLSPPGNLTLPLTLPAHIEVSLKVQDGVKKSFSDRTLVQVPSGSSLLEALEEAEKLLPTRFSFECQTSLYGPFLTTMQGLQASEKGQTYWKLLSGSIPLQQGIADYIVRDGEHIVIILTKQRGHGCLCMNE
ncbi:transcobalamin-1-like [Amblyraja radiata]|uniref:transcobalamin-1-like n=1 Tax=Amblyraja radiata TaxID=386614 RepID=UPI0014033001|nr:transcobalamin-1-like [Amblyraja radiata]